MRKPYVKLLLMCVCAPLVFLLGCASPQGRASEQAIVPNPAIQKQIARTMRSEDTVAFVRETLKLQAVADARDDNAELIRQLIHYMMRAEDDQQTPTERDAIALDLVMPLLQIRAADIVRAMAPYLENGDQKLKQFLITGIFSGVAGQLGHEPKDLEAYGSYVAWRRNNLPVAFVELMYRKSPTSALRELMDALLSASIPADKMKYRDLLWAEHVVSDMLWKKRHKFLGPEDTEAALEQLAKLLQFEEWWVRLYVAEILRRNPELQRVDLMGRLADDPHPIVRRTPTAGRALVSLEPQEISP